MSNRSPQKITFDGHLSDHMLPQLRFDAVEIVFADVQAAWTALNNNSPLEARQIAVNALASGEEKSKEEKAALNAAIAGSEYVLGGLDAADRYARRSLTLYPKQFTSNRIVLAVLTLRRRYSAAYKHMVDATLPKRKARWDEGLSLETIELALASWAWNCKAWKEVRMHLSTAVPGGVSDMPTTLVEDTFKLSLYLDSASGAAAAAERLIVNKSIDLVDQILQTIVKSGWTKEALPLYRSAFMTHPTDDLLRRRLVGLCIREGQIEEARMMAKGGGLRTAA
ncbi:MAG: hypothetical protein E2O84_04450 [Bacteroidetes bacterium]|nr:MAG: hypothetical protein E2O84_04450 [Bacteroidota bacterium]